MTIRCVVKRALKDRCEKELFYLTNQQDLLSDKTYTSEDQLHKLILSAIANIPAVLYRCLFWEVFSRLRNKLLIKYSYPLNNQIRNGPAIPI